MTDGDRPKRKLYIAGPLFSDAERHYNIKVKRALEPFFEVFLPQEDGGLLLDMIKDGSDVTEAAVRVFSVDLDAIKKTDYLLIIMDGRSIDEGAAFELGLAFCSGVCCIGLQTDSRRLLPVGNNPMISCALRNTLQDIDELVAWAFEVTRV